MTEEERNNAIKVLRNFDLNNPKVNSLLFSADEITNAFELAIKALEQEPILDKVRAEIVDLGQRTMNDNRASGIWACRDIIDKYKAESEEE